MIQLQNKVFLFLVVSIFVLNKETAKSQSNVNIKLLTLSYQFNDNNTNLANRSIDEDGRLAFESGFIFAYETFANTTTSLKIATSFYYDKASKLAGFQQVLIRFRLFNAFKHSMSVGFGPSFNFRQTWATMDGYKDYGIYNNNGDWQTKMSWLSGELEYNYYISKNANLSVSINLINPQSVGLAVGYKYWISKKPKRKRGCVSCPSFH